MGTISVFDCTLREGGLCIQDFDKNGVEVACFSDDDKISFANSITSSNVELIELGYINENEDVSEYRFCNYGNIESLSKYIPSNRSKSQMFAAMFVGPDGGLDSVPDYRPGLCECLRVILRYSELEKSLDFCKGLSKKGYKVFVQPMLTMRYTDEELELIINISNEINAYALYFVDSFGYMTEHDVDRLFKFFDSRLDKSIKIGFHAHNNMNLAMSNVKYFIDNCGERDIIVDSCILGMGQGAGNMQTEILIEMLNSNYGKNYNFADVLDCCDLISKSWNYGADCWGYSPLNLIPAKYKTA